MPADDAPRGGGTTPREPLATTMRLIRDAGGEADFPGWEMVCRLRYQDYARQFPAGLGLRPHARCPDLMWNDDRFDASAPIPISRILDAAGVDAAVWCLRACLPGQEEERSWVKWRYKVECQHATKSLVRMPSEAERAAILRGLLGGGEEKVEERKPIISPEEAVTELIKAIGRPNWISAIGVGGGTEPPSIVVYMRCMPSGGMPDFVKDGWLGHKVITQMFGEFAPLGGDPDAVNANADLAAEADRLRAEVARLEGERDAVIVDRNSLFTACFRAYQVFGIGISTHKVDREAARDGLKSALDQSLARRDARAGGGGGGVTGPTSSEPG